MILELLAIPTCTPLDWYEFQLFFTCSVFIYSVNYRFLGMLNFTLLPFKDGSELACTEPQSVGGTGKVIATPVRNDNASKPAVDDTLVKDPKDEQSTKPSGEGPAVPANADPPKPDSQQKADEKEKEDDNKEVGADGEPNVSKAMQEMNRKARPTGWLHFKNAQMPIVCSHIFHLYCNHVWAY